MSNNQRRRGPRPATNGHPVATSVAAPLRFTTPETRPFAEREPCFAIDGREYTCLKQVPASAVLAYVELGGRLGAEPAIIFALSYTLGDESYDALRYYESLTDEQLAAVTQKVRAKFEAPLDPKAR